MNGIINETQECDLETFLDLQCASLEQQDANCQKKHGTLAMQGGMPEQLTLASDAMDLYSQGKGVRTTRLLILKEHHHAKLMMVCCREQSPSK
jgi:hypothetical protein